MQHGVFFLRKCPVLWIVTTLFIAMVLAGVLAGLAGTASALGTDRFLSTGIAAGVGFDAITVALLGRSKPLGTVLSGILFGAFTAGASTMQAAADIPVDIVSVSQAIIVLLIAAPPLIRWIFHLPEPRQKHTAQPRSRGAKKGGEDD